MFPKIRKIFFFNLILVSTLLMAGNRITLNLTKCVELGKDDFMFYSIGSVCEDNYGNFYVLDYKAYKVYKFSPEGKLILTFGNRGQGPADMARPHSVQFTAENNIAVCEVQGFISFFDNNGNFLKKIRIPKGLGLKYLNDNLFYGWEWKRKSKQQVLINDKGKILKSFFEVSKDLFSVSAPDETGRMVMSNFYTQEYTPALLFDFYKERAVIGVGNIYEILIINKNGEVLDKIKRDVKPLEIKSKEIDYFKNEINSKKNLHDYARKKFIKKIPGCKNYFDKILISEKYVFVFRIKEDITNEKSLIPVDIFTIKGEFVGTSALENRPVLITGKWAYFVELSDEDLLLIKYLYTIR